MGAARRGWGETAAAVRAVLRSVPFHPLILCVYPILFLYSRNVVFIPFRDTWRLQAISLAVAVFLVVGFGLILRDWHKAAVVCSLLLVMFFSYGQLANVSEGSPLESLFENHARVMVGIWFGLFLLLLLVIMRADVPPRITGYLNLSSLVLVLLPTSTILLHSYVSIHGDQSRVPELASIRGEQSALANTESMAAENKPDIYYIILDGYLRPDKLTEFYGYDDSAFMDALQARRFYIADRSRSNYLSTTYSLNTSLNLVYFSDFPKRIIPTARYDLKTNYLSEFLRAHGYQVIVFDSGTGDTNDQYADRFLTPHEGAASSDEGGINRFEQLMLRTTLGAILFKNNGSAEGASTQNQVAASMEDQLQLGRDRIEYAFEHLPDFASSGGPYYVFAHIYLPHIPFLYDPNGQPLHYREDLHLTWYQLRHEDYAEYYGYQLDYLDKAVLGVVDEIAARSERPYVIVIQSDHGDDLYLDWDHPTSHGVDIRSAILYSVYYSSEDYGSFYPSVTPVNTFRIVLDDWFGAHFPLLVDKVYYHEHPLMTPFYRIPDFRDACPDLDICPSR
jgi:hypothetical protein